MDYTTIMAGLLHDVVEDTKLTVDDIEKELGILRSQLKSGVEAIALPPSDLNVNEVKTVEIQEVEVEVELDEMKKSMDNS